MEKVINWFNREQLINYNQKIEAVGNFLMQVEPKELELDNSDFVFKIGTLIYEEAQKVKNIIGSYGEFSKAHDRGELE